MAINKVKSNVQSNANPSVKIDQNKVLTQRLASTPPVKTPGLVAPKVFIRQPTDLFIAPHAPMAPKFPQLSFRDAATELAQRQASADFNALLTGNRRT